MKVAAHPTTTYQLNAVRERNIPRYQNASDTNYPIIVQTYIIFTWTPTLKEPITGVELQVTVKDVGLFGFPDLMRLTCPS